MIEKNVNGNTVIIFGFDALGETYVSAGTKGGINILAISDTDYTYDVDKLVDNSNVVMLFSEIESVDRIISKLEKIKANILQKNHG